MGVYINSMEMPKEPLMMVLFPTGVIETEEYEIGHNAKAFAVPNHGRLIDADNLIDLCNIMADKCDDIGEENWHQFAATVVCSQTIIPADKE